MRRGWVVAVGVVAVLAGGCAHAKRSPSTSASATTTTQAVAAVPGTPRGIVEIGPGMCFNEVPDPTERPLAVLVVPCDTPHLYEAYDVIKYSPPGGAPAGRSYPGKEQMRIAAEDSCYTTFEAWMGVEWRRSDFDIATWWPSADSWIRNDRTILCSVYRAVGGTTTGSVRGTGQ